MSTPTNVYEPGYFDSHPPVDPTAALQVQIKALQELVDNPYLYNEMVREWAAKRLAQLGGRMTATPSPTQDESPSTSLLMADARDGIADFRTTGRRVVFLTRDGIPVIPDTQELMPALEKEIEDCLNSCPKTTWISGNQAVFCEEVTDPGAVQFLIQEANRYLGLMVSVADALREDGEEVPYAFINLGASEGWIVHQDLIHTYEMALAHYFKQQESQ